VTRAQTHRLSSQVVSSAKNGPLNQPQEDGPILAEHVAEAVDAVATFHEEHYSKATALQKLVDRVTGAIGRPQFVAALLAVVVVWVAATLSLTAGGISQPSLAWLEFAATLLALLVSLLILVTQRREDVLAERRAQLILQLSLLADRKSAKIIELLEELRRDSPAVHNRVDTESEDMQKAADPKSVLDAIDKRSDKPT
jgi:uncharacterized membrane protein